MEEREKEKKTKVQPFLRPSGAAYKFDLGYFSYIKYGKTVVFVCNPLIYVLFSIVYFLTYK